MTLQPWHYATAAAVGSSAFSSDELQSLIAALITLAVRELFAWFARRSKTP